MNKKITAVLICTFLLLTLHATVYAVGSGNIDNGGGEMGYGLTKYYWNIGDDGVRVTVVRDSDNTVVSTPVDFTNKHPGNIQLHFGKVSKLQYRNGARLTPNTGSYTYNNPALALPKIISVNGNGNIAAIKSYFTDELVIRYVAKATGFSFDSLISGRYKLLLEPVAYFTYNGLKVAMTAHEAALYDQMLGGKLRYYIPSLTHKNLPLAMFLETSDLGFPAWNGSTNTKVTDSQIRSSLGLGIVRFRDADPLVVIDSTDFKYRVDTDVITAVTVYTESRITPDNPATATFYINGHVYDVKDIVIPAQDSQVVWVKWHTPPYPTTLSITVSVNRGIVSRATFNAQIIDFKENIPPNPTAHDTKPIEYKIPAVPAASQKTSASWGVWSCSWQPDWEWQSDWNWVPDGKGGGEWVDNGRWVDNGDWKYAYTGYKASLAAKMYVTADSKVPVASEKTIRSGYGINLKVEAKLQSNAPSSAITGVQNVLSYYPEFNYTKYLRVCDMLIGGYYSEFELKPNEYSAYNSRVHFTPLWFPNGSYTPVANAMDAWTPDGMLSCSLSDYVNIQGSLYDDWHIAPKK